MDLSTAISKAPSDDLAGLFRRVFALMRKAAGLPLMHQVKSEVMRPGSRVAVPDAGGSG